MSISDIIPILVYIYLSVGSKVKKSNIYSKSLLRNNLHKNFNTTDIDELTKYFRKLYNENITP